MGYWSVARSYRGPGERDMASKDKGGRASKTAAAHTAKEKKAAKRDKKQEKGRSAKDL